MKKTKSIKGLETFRGFIKAEDLMDSKGNVRTEFKIVPQGKFNTTKYGDVEITSDHIDEMVGNFNEKVRAHVPVDVDHSANSTRAAGWIKKVWKKAGEGLYGVINWTPYGKKLVQNKEYAGFSPEFALEYVHSENSKKYGATLIADSLTNRQLFQDALRQPIMASTLNKEDGADITPVVINFNEDTMSKTIKADDETKEVPTEAPKEAPAEEKTTEKVAEKAPEEEAKVDEKEKEAPAKEDEVSEEAPKEEDVKEKAPEETKEPAEEAPAKEAEKKEAESGESKDKVEKTESASEGKSAKSIKAAVDNSKVKKAAKSKPIKATEKTVSIAASELEAIKAAEFKAREELRKAKVEKEVTDSYLFSERGGKVAPAGKYALVDLLLTFSDSQREMFDTVMKAVPSKKMLGEIGTSQNIELKASEQVHRLVGEKVTAAKKEGARPTDATTAFLEVYKENPDLFKE